MNKTIRDEQINKCIEEFIVQLKEVADDPVIEKRPDLKEIVIQDIKILEKNENLGKLAPKLFQEISTKYIENPKDFPKSLIDLYYWARVETNKYEALVWSDVQAGIDWPEK